MEIYNKLSKICKTKENVNLKNMCSMHIGGVGKYVCYPHNVKQLKKLNKFLIKNHIEHFIVGNGTNIIFEDGGYFGVLICLKEINKVKIKKRKVFADAGVNITALGGMLASNGLSGLEWAYGIPGTVGGAVIMNAGAYGVEIKNVVKNIWVLRRGRVKKIKAKKAHFDYRNSIFKHNGDIILKAGFNLIYGDPAVIQKKQNELLAYRKVCQPYGTFNAGSIFKKTINGSAGKTIDKQGLKSVKIGDMRISEKHANFFINQGNATSEDLHKLINYVKSKVKEETGVILEEEIIFVGNKKE